MKMMKVGRIGRVRALGRFFKDRDASLLGKLFVLAAVFYVVWPADLIPDVPIVGWLDDIGVMGLATAYLSRVIARYRGPKMPKIGESPALEA
jgi:uncharacterized membrane protein YkvA (DUF1232 family)